MKKTAKKSKKQNPDWMTEVTNPFSWELLLKKTNTMLIKK
jgi:hypothetical protein